MFKIAVLISGSGTTLDSIIRDAAKDSVYEVALVISDRICPGIQYARKHHIPHVIIQRNELMSDLILKEVQSMDLVVLAGFLSILEGKVLDVMKDRIINLHPSLLPSFGGKGMYGMRVHEAVFRSGMRISGCTVHYVNEIIDGGSMILKRIVGLKDAKSPEDVRKKVTAVEKGALIDAIRLIVMEETVNESIG